MLKEGMNKNNRPTSLSTAARHGSGKCTRLICKDKKRTRLQYGKARGLFVQSENAQGLFVQGENAQVGFCPWQLQFIISQHFPSMSSCSRAPSISSSMFFLRNINKVVIRTKHSFEELNQYHLIYLYREYY